MFSSGNVEGLLRDNPAQAAFFKGLELLNDAAIARKAGRLAEAEAKAREGIR